MKNLHKCSMDVHLFLANEREERRKAIITERNKMQSYLDDLIMDIVTVLGVDINKVKSRDRHLKLVTARKLFYYIGRTKAGYSYSDMSKTIGQTDHTSPIYHIKKVNAFLKVKDPQFMETWEHYLTHSKIYTKKDFA